MVHLVDFQILQGEEEVEEQEALLLYISPSEAEEEVEEPEALLHYVLPSEAEEEVVDKV